MPELPPIAFDPKTHPSLITFNENLAARTLVFFHPMSQPKARSPVSMSSIIASLGPPPSHLPMPRATKNGSTLGTRGTPTCETAQLEEETAQLQSQVDGSLLKRATKGGGSSRSVGDLKRANPLFQLQPLEKRWLERTMTEEPRVALFATLPLKVRTKLT